MKNFTRILLIIFFILAVQSIVANTNAITFVYLAIAAIILFIVSGKYFGWIKGILIWLIVLFLPSLMLFITGYYWPEARPLNFTAFAGIEILNGLPIIVPFYFLCLLLSSLFFCRYIIVPKITQTDWYSTFLMLASVAIFSAFCLITIPSWMITNYIYNISLLSYVFWVLIGLICYLAIFKLVRFKYNADPFYIKTASLIFITLAIYAGLINLRANYYVPAAISLFLTIVYLCQKYNFYKIGKLNRAR